MRKHRFFYHFYKAEGIMTVHFRDVCYHVKHVECMVPCETKWRKSQPLLVMQGMAKKVEIFGNFARIS